MKKRRSAEPPLALTSADPAIMSEMGQTVPLRYTLSLNHFNMVEAAGVELRGILRMLACIPQTLMSLHLGFLPGRTSTNQNARILS
jgi:hypothetical protein